MTKKTLILGSSNTASFRCLLWNYLHNTIPKNKQMNNKTIWWDDKDLGYNRPSAFFQNISYVVEDPQNFILFYLFCPALSSMPSWIVLFLLSFLSTSLEVWKLSSQPRTSMKAMWQSKHTALRACELSCCLSRPPHFRWTLTALISQ